MELDDHLVSGVSIGVWRCLLVCVEGEQSRKQNRVHVQGGRGLQPKFKFYGPSADLSALYSL